MKINKSFRPFIAVAWLSLAAVLASCVATKVGGAKPTPSTTSKAPFKIGTMPLVLGNGPNEGGFFSRFARLFLPAGFSSAYDTLPEITTDFSYALSIRTPTGAPTNMIVRAFYTRVGVNFNNAAYPSNTATSLGTNYFEPISGYFTGTQSIALNTNVGDWTDIFFQFRTNGFANLNQGNGFITFVARGTNSTGQVFEGLYAYRFVYPQ